MKKRYLLEYMMVHGTQWHILGEYSEDQIDNELVFLANNDMVKDYRMTTFTVAGD